MIDATLKLFDPATVLPVWSSVLFISGTFETAARMHLLDKDELMPDETGLVQLHFSKPAILSVKDKYIVRNSSNDRTLGGGTIIDTQPLHHRKRTDKLVQNLNDLLEATLHSESIESRVRIELNKINGPAFATDVATLLEKNTADLEADIRSSTSGKICIFDADGQSILLTPALDEGYQKQVLSELESYHSRYPILEDGLETNEFTGKFGFGKNEAGKLYLNILMDRIHGEGLIRKSGNSWVLADHRVEIDSKTQAELKWVESLFKNAGMDVPNTKEIEEKIHERRITKDRYKMLLKHLSLEGNLVFHDGLFFHNQLVDEVQNRLLNKIAAKEDGINEKEFRELVGGTRKFIQVMLSLFINQGIIVKPTFYILITEKGKNLLEQQKK